MSVLVVCLTLVLGACGSSGGGGPGDDPGIPGPPPALTGPVLDLVCEPGPGSGALRLRFTAPEGPTGGRAEAYRIRVAPFHLDAASLASATLVPVAVVPAAPGTAEVIDLTGLEPDRTLQVAVTAWGGGQEGALGLSAAGHTSGQDLPAPPPGAFTLTGPATLDRPGTWLLTRDIQTPGTAFTVTAGGVVLDLGGHTVTYGTGGGAAKGVTGEYLGAGATVVVRNGGLHQATTSTAGGDAVFLRGLQDLRLSYLDIQVAGPDANGIRTMETDGDVRVDHCTIRCATTVVSNRHYPGVSGVFVEWASGGVEIDQNHVTASPQWGIRVAGPSTTGRCMIHHNLVTGTHARVANGYMLAAHKPFCDVFENRVSGESRGIHVDGIDGNGTDAFIHDNDVEFQDQPNAEFPTHWAHGIKLEGAARARVLRNRVVGTADATHSDTYGIDFSVSTARGIEVVGNRVRARSTVAGKTSRAISWAWGATYAPADVVVRENVLAATDVLVYRDWDGGQGGLFQGNWWIRDLSQGAGHAFAFEHFGNGDQVPSPGHRMVDDRGGVDRRLVTQWASPAAYDSTRSSTLTVLVRAGATPLAGARVQVRDRLGALVLDATTGASGRVAGVVREHVVTPGPTFTELGPHAVSVSRSGYATWQGPVALGGPTGVVVDLAAGQASADVTAPPAPTGLHAHPVAGSRGALWWETGEDETGIAAWLVEIDGEVVGVPTQPGLLVSGLRASTPYVVTVHAIDGAGHVGPAATAAFTTRPEDRGP